MSAHYDPTFVVLSFVVAIFASGVALNLAGTVVRAKGMARFIWLIMGSLAMGIGIWSMHFIGMEAFEMPGMQMSYDVPLMIWSVVIAIVGSGIALGIVGYRHVSKATVFIGGVAMAAAICGMHYTGMYSMRMAATTIWNPWLVGLSIVIALAASFAALLIAIGLRETIAPYRKSIASVFMGIAIAGMHYTGMFAATFVHAAGEAPAYANVIHSEGLGFPIFISTFIILALALAGSILDRMFAAKNRRAAEIETLLAEARSAISKYEEERSLRERFVSALAHDLRTPLAAATMAAELTSMQQNDPRTIGLAAKTLENLKRMNDMIEDLLDVHRVSAGEALPIQREPCDLSVLADAVLKNLTMIYGDRFAFNCSGAVRVNWDKRYIARTLENLCTNAVKYGSETEKIRVTVENLGPQAVSISVCNQGPPLDEKNHELLFSLFSRGKPAQTANQRGWGIGLTIVKGVMDAHGGSVVVSSSAESGTTFRLECPTGL